MADRSANLIGTFQRVTLGSSSKILGAGKYEISGITRRTIDASEFGVDIDIFEFGAADAGTITLSDANFDPTDPCQNYLHSCASNAFKLSQNSLSGIRFWLNNTSYMTIGTSGFILMTSAGKVIADRNGFAKTEFTGKVSGAFMIITASS